MTKQELLHVLSAIESAIESAMAIKGCLPDYLSDYLSDYLYVDLTESVKILEREKQMTPPKIGQHWPEKQGIYAGIARGFKDEPDGHIVLLDDTQKSEMNWEDAMAWASGLGDGARLPARFEMALIGANISDKIGQNGFYWSASDCSKTHAWIQFWDSSHTGDQGTSWKMDSFYVRAIRRLAV
jgi:hypothetical protein